jgi:hypothetical protein
MNITPRESSPSMQCREIAEKFAPCGCWEFILFEVSERAKGCRKQDDDVVVVVVVVGWRSRMRVDVCTQGDDVEGKEKGKKDEDQGSGRRISSWKEIRRSRKRCEQQADAWHPTSAYQLRNTEDERDNVQMSQFSLWKSKYVSTS